MSEDSPDLEPIPPWYPGGAPVATGWPPPPMYPRPPNRRGQRTAAIVAGLVALVLLAGAVGYAIEASTEDNSSSRASPLTTLPPGPTTPAPVAADRIALSKLVVRQSDVDSARVVVLIPNGNRTTQPTLDLCNGTFAT